MVTLGEYCKLSGASHWHLLQPGLNYDLVFKTICSFYFIRRNRCEQPSHSFEAILPVIHLCQSPVNLSTKLLQTAFLHFCNYFPQYCSRLIRRLTGCPAEMDGRNCGSLSFLDAHTIRRRHLGASRGTLPRAGWGGAGEARSSPPKLQIPHFAQIW